MKKTPTLFINGRRYDGPMDATAIVAASQPAMEPAPGISTSPGRFL